MSLKFKFAAGKEVLIKSVVQAIPTYVMQCFSLPKSLIHELEVQIRRFVWGGVDGASKIHWKSWATCCLSKSQGGLGYRDLGAFNRALLAKQAWRLLKTPTSLAGSILKAKYFQDVDILSARLGARPSFMWRSLLEGRNLLALGIRWRVGDGRSIRVYSDVWLPLEPYFKPILGPHSLAVSSSVRDLMLENGREWDVRIIREHFLSHEADRILEIPLSQSSQADKLIWHYHTKGVYTVKSGYHLAVTRSQILPCSAGPSSSLSLEDELWKLIWSCSVQPRVKHFLWRLIHDCLPLALHLKIRGIGDGCCGVCKGANEDLFHSFIDCMIPMAVYERSELMQRTLRRKPLSMRAWLLEVHEQEGEEGFCVLSNVLWQVWKARCAAIFDDKPVYTSSILAVAEKQAEDFRHAITALVPPTVVPSWPSSWSPPSNGFVKVNVDGAMGQTHCAVEFLLRDLAGSVIYAASQVVPYTTNVDSVELRALHSGLAAAFALGYSHIQLESDSLTAFSKLTSNDEDLSVLGGLVDSIKSLASCFSDVQFMFVKRSGNMPAHLLARNSIVTHVSSVWNQNIPYDVSSAVLADLE